MFMSWLYIARTSLAESMDHTALNPMMPKCASKNICGNSGAYVQILCQNFAQLSCATIVWLSKNLLEEKRCGQHRSITSLGGLVWWVTW